MENEGTTKPGTNVVFCVEATAGMAKLWDQDYEMYLDPLLKALEGGKLGMCWFATVLYGASPPYSGVSVERSGWMMEVAQVRKCLAAAPLWGGGGGEACVAEALTDCIFLLEQASVARGSATYQNSLGSKHRWLPAAMHHGEVQQHVLLVTCSDPHRLRVQCPQGVHSSALQGKVYTDVVSTLRRRGIGLSVITDHGNKWGVTQALLCAQEDENSLEGIRGQTKEALQKMSIGGGAERTLLVSPRWHGALEVMKAVVAEQQPIRQPKAADPVLAALATGGAPSPATSQPHPPHQDPLPAPPPVHSAARPSAGQLPLEAQTGGPRGSSPLQMQQGILQETAMMNWRGMGDLQGGARLVALPATLPALQHQQPPSLPGDTPSHPVILAPIQQPQLPTQLSPPPQPQQQQQPPAAVAVSHGSAAALMPQRTGTAAAHTVSITAVAATPVPLWEGDLVMLAKVNEAAGDTAICRARCFHHSASPQQVDASAWPQLLLMTRLVARKVVVQHMQEDLVRAPRCVFAPHLPLNPGHNPTLLNQICRRDLAAFCPLPEGRHLVILINQTKQPAAAAGPSLQMTGFLVPNSLLPV